MGLKFKEMRQVGKVLSKRETKVFTMLDESEQYRLYEILENNTESFKEEFRVSALQFRDNEAKEKNESQPYKTSTEDKAKVVGTGFSALFSIVSVIPVIGIGLVALGGFILAVVTVIGMLLGF